MKVPESDIIIPKNVHVLVDQDNTIADFDGGWLKIWRTRFPNRPYVQPWKRRTFKIIDQYAPKYHSDVQAIYSGEGFMRDLPPIPGAIDALKQMAEVGINLTVVTTPLSRHTPEKLEWLARHLGQQWADQAIFTRDKTEVAGDLLIDDNPDISGAYQPIWQQVVFDRSYNRHRRKMRRLYNWLDWPCLFKVESPTSD